MLAHIKDEKVIRTYHGTGRVKFESGKTISPPAAGVYGNERLVPVVVETVDNATTTRTKSATVETVEADRVLRTVTITDVPIADIRAGMVVSVMQGILTLGESNWNKVLAYRNQEFVAATDDSPEIPETPWPEKMIIDSAQDWRRTSKNIQFIGELIGFDDEQMDALFTSASLVEI